jgi:hypothetical protein
MSLEGRSHPIWDHHRLAWAFAEILARDEKRAEALFRTALLEASAPTEGIDRSSAKHRLLAAVREGYYRGEEAARLAEGELGSEDVCGRASSSPLGCAVDVLPSEDRELLFLRYAAGLDLPEIVGISGWALEVARVRIVELCAALSAPSGERHAAPTIH